MFSDEKSSILERNNATAVINSEVPSFQFFFDAFTSNSIGASKKKLDNSQKSVTKTALSFIEETTFKTYSWSLETPFSFKTGMYKSVNSTLSLLCMYC